MTAPLPGDPYGDRPLHPVAQLPVGASSAAGPTSMVNDVIEWVGFACLVGCAYMVWPPAALGLAGILLVVIANVRDGRAERQPGPGLSTKLSAALTAYREVGTHPTSTRR